MPFLGLEQMERKRFGPQFFTRLLCFDVRALLSFQEICVGNVSNYFCQPSSSWLVYLGDHTLLLLIWSA